MGRALRRPDAPGVEARALSRQTLNDGVVAEQRGCDARGRRRVLVGG